MKRTIPALIMAATLLAACGDNASEREAASLSAELSRVQESIAKESIARESIARENREAEASRSREAERRSREAEFDRELATVTRTARPTTTPEPTYAAPQFPSPPYAAPAGFEWAAMGPYGTGTSSNCVQLQGQWPSGTSECFEMPDGWYFYGLRQSGPR